MTRMPPQTFQQLMRDNRRDLDELGRRGKPGLLAGPAAIRDIRFPPPTTAEERRILADRQISWLNTDLDAGYRERYYGALDDPGANVRNSAKVAGWYPYDIDMPHMRLDFGRVNLPTLPSSTEIVVGNVSPANMAWEETYDPHNWFNLGPGSTEIRPHIAGTYRCFFHTQFNTSTGSFWATIRRNNAAASADPYNRQMAQNGAGFLGQPVEVVAEFNLNGTTDFLNCTVWNGGPASQAARGFFVVEYVRPLQVSWFAT